MILKLLSKKLLSKSFIKKFELCLVKLKFAFSKTTFLIEIFFKEKRLSKETKAYIFFTPDISTLSAIIERSFIIKCGLGKNL